MHENRRMHTEGHTDLALQLDINSPSKSRDAVRVTDDNFLSTKTAAALNPGFPMTNILVWHSNALASAGLMATMQRISRSDVHEHEGINSGQHLVEPRLDIRLLVANCTSLSDSAAVQVNSVAPLGSPKPQIVLLTASAEGEAPMPPGVSARLAVGCHQDDLLEIIRSLIGAPPSEESPKVAATLPADVAAPRLSRRLRGGLAPAVLRRVREHIESSIGEHIELGDLAALSRLSPSHFSRAFKESVGMPPHRYVMSRRICIASRLIESTDLPMSEIALEAGFSDQSHFTRVFTAQMGESPRRYRHQRR